MEYNLVIHNYRDEKLNTHQEYKQHVDDNFRSNSGVKTKKLQQD